jgi:hypothetical protein
VYRVLVMMTRVVISIIFVAALDGPPLGSAFEAEGVGSAGLFVLDDGFAGTELDACKLAVALDGLALPNLELGWTNPGRPVELLVGGLLVASDGVVAIGAGEAATVVETTGLEEAIGVPDSFSSGE